MSLSFHAPWISPIIRQYSTWNTLGYFILFFSHYLFVWTIFLCFFCKNDSTCHQISKFHSHSLCSSFHTGRLSFTAAAELCFCQKPHDCKQKLCINLYSLRIQRRRGGGSPPFTCRCHGESRSSVPLVTSLYSRGNSESTLSELTGPTLTLSLTLTLTQDYRGRSSGPRSPHGAELDFWLLDCHRPAGLL